MEVGRQRTNGRGVDVAIEAAGDVDAIRQVVPLAAIHGVALVEGIPASGEVAFDIDLARRRELRMIFGRRSLGKTEEAVELLERGEFDASVMLTHEFALDDTQTAFEYTRDYRDGVIKAIIKP